MSLAIKSVKSSIFWLDKESLTQNSAFSLPQLVSSALDSFTEEQRIQVLTCRVAVNSSQSKHSQDYLNATT